MKVFSFALMSKQQTTESTLHIVIFKCGAVDPRSALLLFLSLFSSIFALQNKNCKRKLEDSFLPRRTRRQLDDETGGRWG